jgi:hypothetical protein
VRSPNWRTRSRSQWQALVQPVCDMLAAATLPGLLTDICISSARSRSAYMLLGGYFASRTIPTMNYKPTLVLCPRACVHTPTDNNPLSTVTDHCSACSSSRRTRTHSVMSGFLPSTLLSRRQSSAVSRVTCIQISPSPPSTTPTTHRPPKITTASSTTTYHPPPPTTTTTTITTTTHPPTTTTITHCPPPPPTPLPLPPPPLN